MEEGAWEKKGKKKKIGGEGKLKIMTLNWAVNQPIYTSNEGSNC